MTNNQKSKKIFLSGGGEAKDSFLLDKEFVKSILASNKKSLLYIPIALERVSYESCYDWITKTLTAHTNEFIDITMWTDLSEKKQKQLDKFDAVYIGGGNTFKLLHQFCESNFFSFLLKYINNGGIVYGGSAGAIIIGKDINTSQDNRDKQHKHDKGLSVIGRYVIFCHYDKKLDKKIISYIEKYNNPVIAIPEKSGLKIEGKQAVVIGDKPVVIFNLNKEKKVIEVSKKFNYIK